MVGPGQDHLCYWVTKLTGSRGCAGWRNSCYHWSVTVQRGQDGANISLVGMKAEILWLMKRRSPVALAFGTAVQSMQEEAETYFMEMLAEQRSAAAPKGVSIYEQEATEGGVRCCFIKSQYICESYRVSTGSGFCERKMGGGQVYPIV